MLYDFCVDMNFLLWNIRGIGKGERTKPIRNIVGKNNISFMGLVETKHKRSLSRRMKRMWGNDVFDFCEVLASETTAGGLIASWDTAALHVSNRFSGDRWILLEGCLSTQNF